MLAFRLNITILFVSFFLLASCSKEIKLNLPVYEPKLVLEFYLEDNQPIKCLLQESIPFTDTAQFKLVENALIVLSHNGVYDTLLNAFYFDDKFQKAYNYYNPKILKLIPDTDYEVYVKDNRGREIRGRTRLNNIVPINNLVFTFNSSNKAAVGLVFSDDGSTDNHYRIVAFKDSSVLNENEVWDITFEDNLFNGKQFSFYTGYAFNSGDTITGRLYHLTEEHNAFTESVNNAQSSNGNPFGQPANIISNLSGGIGIFTTVVYDEAKIVIQ